MFKLGNNKKGRYYLKFLFISFSILVWLFSGWPQIMNFPPKVPRAQAAFTARTETTAGANLASLSAPYDLSCNTPGDLINGDIMFLWVGLRNSWSYIIDSIDSGWIPLGSNTSNVDKYYLYYRIADNEPASYTVSASGASYFEIVMTAYSAGDWDSSDPIDVVSNTAYRTTNNKVRAASMTVNAANSPLVFFGGIYGGSRSYSFTKPANIGSDSWTEDFDNYNSTGDFGVEIDSMIRTSSGATGDMDSTYTVPIPNKHAFAVALNPAIPLSLTVNQPDGSDDTVTVGDSYNINYDLLDSNGTATVDFYYDSNNSGLDGTVISGCQNQIEGLGATCSWNTTGVSPGIYYVYGVADDGISSTVTDYSSGMITINSNIVVSVSVSDGTVSYGVLANNATTDTTSGGLDDSQTASNDGNVTENFNIKGQNSANWTLSGSNGTDTYRHRFCTSDCDASPTWTALTTNYQTLASGVATSGNQAFDLEIQTPNPSTVYTEQNVDVTVQAISG